MADCHHKDCCACQRPAEIIAEAVGGDGYTRFDLCEAHHLLLMQEAARKGVMVMTSPLDDPPLP